MVFAQWARASNPFPLSYFCQTPVSSDFRKIANSCCYSWSQWDCLTLLWISITLSSLFFSLWNRFVIHFKGVQCDWTCLGWFSKNSAIKQPHSLSAKYVSLHGSSAKMWVYLCLAWHYCKPQYGQLAALERTGLGLLAYLSCCLKNIISSIEALLRIVFRWMRLSQHNNDSHN